MNDLFCHLLDSFLVLAILFLADFLYVFLDINGEVHGRALRYFQSMLYCLDHLCYSRSSYIYRKLSGPNGCYFQLLIPNSHLLISQGIVFISQSFQYKVRISHSSTLNYRIISLILLSLALAFLFEFLWAQVLSSFMQPCS